MENQNIRIHLKAYDNKILDFTITLYSNRLKIVKEVVCKPTEVEKVIDELDEQASIPRRGDGHHGYYIEVEVRRYKDVFREPDVVGKRRSESTARKASAVRSGGRRHEDDSKPRGNSRRARSGVRQGVDDLSGSKGRGNKAQESSATGKGTRARSERAIRQGVQPARSRSTASGKKSQGARAVSRKKER